MRKVIMIMYTSTIVGSYVFKDNEGIHAYQYISITDLKTSTVEPRYKEHLGTMNITL